MDDNDSSIEESVEIKLEERIPPCANCTKWFTNHQSIHDYMCDQCMTSIADKENIELKDKFKCNLCELKLRTRNEFVYHINCDYEYGNLEYLCVLCGTCWKSDQQLKDHNEQCHVEYECDHCGVTLEGEETMHLHLVKIHKVTF